MSITTLLSTALATALGAAVLTGTAAGAVPLGVPLAVPLAGQAAGQAGGVPASERAHGGDRACERRFDRAVRTYVEATDERDARTFNALLHPEVTAVLPGGATLVGRTEVAGFIEGFFARTEWTQTLEVRHTAVAGCDTALVLFDSVYTDGDGAVPLAIIITWTYERGQWQVLVDQNTVVSG